jgi:hypothetical protein
MPLPGGDADKAGNRYELRWTVRQFIRLLTDDAVWIELEPIGEEGDRIEFRLCRSDGRIEAHQVKRQQAGKAHWTIADLARAHVLEGLRKHALDNDTEFVFVSTQPTKSLPELRDRAQAITDFSAFQKSLPLPLAVDFDDLQRRHGVDSGEETWRAVRQSRWIPADERELDDTVLALLGAYLTGDPGAALGVLSMFALEAVHRHVTAAELLDVLAQRGIESSDVARDRNLAARLRQCQQDYLESQEFGIGDLALPRREADQAIDILLDPDQSTRSVFLVGPAGMGKTGATGQVVRRIAQTGWPLLPFRLDRLDPTQRPAEIGRQLLGREKSPVAILAGLAAGGDCLLVIEQLDAVSVVSGRRPEVFDAVASLVREARAHANMRLLLVCRAFDLENDARLRDLREQEKTRATTISVGPLDQEQVKQVVAHLDLPPEQFTPSQIELLRLPLHLALLAGVTTRDDHGPFRFSSAKDLYDAFWRQKRSDLLQVLSDQNAFEILLYALCEAMNERQALSVPRGCLPPGDADLDRLVSANVCARQGRRIGLFHEGFFDYVFARRFCETGEPLLDLLRSAEQDLFRRSQVRQILAYRRDDDFDAYLRDLGDCLAAPDVRFHIKKLMIGVVGQVIDPRPKEWAILEGQLGEQTVQSTDPVRAALWSSAPWFRFLHDQGVLTGWLASERPETSFAFNWLRHIAESEPDRVADLLEGQAGASSEQDERILGVLCWHEPAADSERLEALFQRLAMEPERDWAFICGAFKTFIHNHCYRRSRGVDVACRAVGRWLEILAHADSGPELFSHDRETQRVLSEHDLAELVKRAPDAFVNATIAPWLELLEHAADRDSDPPYDDRIWRGGFRELTHWVPEALIISIVAALKRTAASSPTLFRSAIDQLSASECQTAHAVLVRALAIKDGAWKSVAIDYLVESWNRWRIWYDDQARWDCGELLRTLSPFLDEADVARLEPWLLADFERWQPSGTDEAMQDRAAIRERARWFRWSYGQHQHLLLRVLPTNLLSEAASRRQGELARKAASLNWRLDSPHWTKGGWVQSPLPDAAAKWMTDAQWLSAIREYVDDKERVWLHDRILGGARELARALEKRTKEEPDRFARLMLTLPEDANEHYFEAVVMGLQEGEVPLDLLRQVVERAHERPGRPHGRWLPQVIVRHGDQDLPSALLDVVSWYATKDPDPAEELWQQDAGGQGPYYSGDPYEHGINTARGSGAQAVARLIARDQRYWEHFAPVLERMVADPSIAVRSCVAHACTQALRYDRGTAIALFLRLCDAEDELLGAHPVEEFLHYTARAEFDHVWPILERMLASSVVGARITGARQLTLAALSEEIARALAETAMRGDSETRKGAAEVLSHNVFVAPDRAYCETSLIRLFDDPDSEVRTAAGNWTQHARDEKRIEPALSVAESFVESPAFAESAESFFWTIEEAVDAPPSLLLRAGHRFLDLVGSAAGDLRQSSAATADSLSNLILRAYRQAEQDPDLRRQCLDLFDRMLEVGGYGADEAIEAFSR